jgi:UDP-GlcNAc:undecaprenyl-phosphate GlcNAc-1-phosphate transferase
MLIGGRTPDVSGQTYFFFAPLFIPVFILGVPIADMAFAFIRRTARGTGFHTPDKDHVHHRLLRLGHGPRRTVAILWAWTAVLSAFLLLPLFDKRANAFILIGIIVLGLALYTLFHPGLRKDTMNGNGAVQAEDPLDDDAELGPARIASSPTSLEGVKGVVEEIGENGESAGNGIRSGGSEVPRAATPVTHVAFRVKDLP